MASLTTCRLHGAAIQSASPLGPGRALTLPCGWNIAGLNCLRFYGFPTQLLQTSPATLALLRQVHADHGLRVLFTLPAYKDASQKSKATVIARPVAISRLGTTARTLKAIGCSRVTLSL